MASVPDAVAAVFARAETSPWVPLADFPALLAPGGDGCIFSAGSETLAHALCLAVNERAALVRERDALGAEIERLRRATPEVRSGTAHDLVTEAITDIGEVRILAAVARAHGWDQPHGMTGETLQFWIAKQLDQRAARERLLAQAEAALSNVKNMIDYCRLSYGTKVKKGDDDAASMVHEYEYCIAEGQARVDEALDALAGREEST